MTNLPSHEFPFQYVVKKFDQEVTLTAFGGKKVSQLPSFEMSTEHALKMLGLHDIQNHDELMKMMMMIINQNRH